MTVGIYYATTTGKTEDVADRLHNFISSAEALGILVPMKKDQELHGIQS